MRKADVEVGVDYRVKGYPAGRVRLESLEGRTRHRVTVTYYPTADGGDDRAASQGPQQITLADVVARKQAQAAHG